MKYQEPPREIDPNNSPPRFHAMDQMTMRQRNTEDERAIETLLIEGHQRGLNVFLKYDRSANEFKYITGNHWHTDCRFVGTIPEQKGKSL